MRTIPINPLTQALIQPMIAAGLPEGFGFVQRLWDDYLLGVQTFSEPGAALLGIFEEEACLAIGGVHPDPYLNDPQIGRIRHVYVLPDYRRHGLGRQLMTALIDHASGHFSTLTLRTLTKEAAAFYVSLGFSDVPRYDQATHWLDIGNT